MDFRNKVHKLGGLWAIALILVMYLIPQFLLVNKPGLEEDEAVFLVPSMELAQGKEISYGYSMNLFGLHYPTMLGGYTGNSLTLPVALAVRTFGFHLALIRSLWLLVGAGTILFTFLACRELFNISVGLLAALLLAINPTYWMFTHVGAYCSANMTLDVMGSLFFFLYFYRTRRLIWLFLAMFLTGHGIYTKLAFGYFLAAYFISFGALWIRRRLDREIVSLRNLSIGGLAILLGGWPFFYNLAVNGRSTIEALKTSLLGSSLQGESNLHVWHNSMIRLSQTNAYLLEGRTPIDSMVAGMPVGYNFLMPYVFWGALLFLLGAMLWPGPRPVGKDRVAFIVLAFCLFQFLIVFTPSSLNNGVYAFIPPFMSAALALAFYLLFGLSASTERKHLGWAVAAAVILLLFTETKTLWSQYGAILRTGGRRTWSSTIFQVNEYLQRHVDRTPVALDWGLDHPIYVLSNLGIRPSSSYIPFTFEHHSLKLWQLEPPPDFSFLMEKLILQPRNIYLARDGSLASFKKRLVTLERVVQKSGGELEKIQSFIENDGRESIGIYQVRWPSGQEPKLSLNDIPMDDLRGSRYPEINRLYPERSVVGEKFNIQPDGNAAIAIAGKRFDGSSTVCLNDEPVPTTFGNEELVTAVVPNKFLQLPGEVKVSITNRDHFKSNTLVLTVLPN